MCLHKCDVLQFLNVKKQIHGNEIHKTRQKNNHFQKALKNFFLLSNGGAGLTPFGQRVATSIYSSNFFRNDI